MKNKLSIYRNGDPEKVKYTRYQFPNLETLTRGMSEVACTVELVGGNPDVIIRTESNHPKDLYYGGY